MIVTRTELRAIDPAENTHKFYRITLTDDNTVQFEWGRIGTTGRSQIKSYGNLRNVAQHHYEAKLREKLNKGYQIYNTFNNSSELTHNISNKLESCPKKSENITIETIDLFYD